MHIAVDVEFVFAGESESGNGFMVGGLLFRVGRRTVDGFRTMQVRIHVPSQTLDLIDDSGTTIRCYAISTSRFGLGSEPGSYKTPSGRFRISEKIGDGAPPGEIFISREATGKFGQEGDEKDHVQTRILWLDGLEPENANTHDRYVYIHGTNAESQLGTPASYGCIRMNNIDVIDFYDRVAVDTAVEIQP